MSLPQFSPDELELIGCGLQRPESVLALPDGDLICSDLRGLAAHLGPDGNLRRILGKPGGTPNGLALRLDKTLLVADIGRGELRALSPEGAETVVTASCDGAPLGACNFVLAGPGDSAWITVSSRTLPVSDAIRRRGRDGAVLRWTGVHTERVLDGLDFANEMRISPDGRQLFVAETLAGRISCADLLPGGHIGPLREFGPDPVYPGAFVDGLAFDVQGNLWVAELSRNAILVLTPSGRLHRVVEDPEAKILRKPTSLAFGGPDRRTVYVGSLKMERLARFRAPFPGAPLAHW